jgi:hypothetical protein
MGERMVVAVGKARAGSGNGSGLHGTSTPAAQFVFGPAVARASRNVVGGRMALGCRTPIGPPVGFGRRRGRVRSLRFGWRR